jgi:hypothetical protein
MTDDQCGVGGYDVTSHERTIPAWQEQHPMHDLCTCGRRRGLHRFGDERCPNPHWRPGNGQPQFVPDESFQP